MSNTKYPEQIVHKLILENNWPFPVTNPNFKKLQLAYNNQQLKLAKQANIQKRFKKSKPPDSLIPALF